MSEVKPMADVRRRARMRSGEAGSLERVTFDLETGELFGSLGRNGAGKITTIRILSALLGATAGAAPRASSRRRPSRDRS